ncbi:hypothetical protein SBRCBS47491_000236 [Sporothrix bragantina]|uniref:Uncharacterized protein n=1 Tax=Sporothrix bragantina TaxID=671064 RepID=A0ABP0ANL9_9PEZI
MAVFLQRRYKDRNDFVRVHNNEMIDFRYSRKKLYLRQADHIDPTDLYVSQVKSGQSDVFIPITFRLENYPYPHPDDGKARPNVDVVGGPYFARQFETLPVSEKLEKSEKGPPPICISMDGTLPSAVLLFTDGAGRRFVVYLALCDEKAKFGVLVDVKHDNMQRLADDILFDKWTGQEATKDVEETCTLHATFSESGDNGSDSSEGDGNGRQTKVSVTLGWAYSGKGFLDERQVIIAVDGSSDFWLDKAGPGLWPGWWARYMEKQMAIDDKGAT